MKKKLLQLNKKSSLSVPEEGKKLLVKGVDFEFDFSGKDPKLSAVFNDVKEDLSTYIISKELVDAVNAAIITGRPLLLKGEPGSGKTKLAKAVAAYFYPKNLNKYYFEWHVKSKSNARDGGYTFDHVSRLRGATIADKKDKDKIKSKDARNYINLGPMGQAFLTSQNKDGNFPILLIDEIDKGDIDFPNDLLLELDEMRFVMNELGEDRRYITANSDNRPLVFITSNDERELPPAFLRRCLYYKIPPFKQALLELITTAKLKKFYKSYNQDKLKEIPEEKVKDLVKKFIKIKEKATDKPPSTSELLDWVKMILYRVNNGEKIDDVITDTDLQKITLKLMK